MNSTEEIVVFGERDLTIEDISRIASGEVAVALCEDKKFTDLIHRGRQFVDSLLKHDGQIYGVTTGFGDSCTTGVTETGAVELSSQLVRFHRCGMGDMLTPEQGRAVMATRLASLVRGKSGVSVELLQQFVRFMDHDIIPQIPSEGSVGASGDLTPMSYVAAALIGEGEVLFRGTVREAQDVLKELELTPHHLKPKEGLAIMNGTAVMTALACLAFKRAEYLCKIASRITSLITVATKGNSFHFDEVLFAAKPFPGQNRIAAFIRSDFVAEVATQNSNRLQDRYSLRCAPHVIGVLQDALPFFRQIIETELNSTNDNPIVDLENERILHGGHFYGGHIAFVMDSMKTLVANIADLIDRQVALLVDPKFNHGLPANLVGATDEFRPVSHGFKAVQIGISAWTAEALKQTMPASVFSRSTECHNQDKVSMGTIAARDCLRVLQLTEQVAAGALLAATQGVVLRKRQGEIDDSNLSQAHHTFLAEIQKEFSFVDRDRPLDKSLRQFVGLIQEEAWDLYY